MPENPTVKKIPPAQKIKMFFNIMNSLVSYDANTILDLALNVNRFWFYFRFRILRNTDNCYKPCPPTDIL